MVQAAAALAAYAGLFICIQKCVCVCVRACEHIKCVCVCVCVCVYDNYVDACMMMYMPDPLTTV